MQQIQLAQPGGLENLKLTEVEVPTPQRSPSASAGAGEQFELSRSVGGARQNPHRQQSRAAVRLRRRDCRYWQRGIKMENWRSGHEQLLSRLARWEAPPRIIEFYWRSPRWLCLRVHRHRRNFAHRHTQRLERAPGCDPAMRWINRLACTYR